MFRFTIEKGKLNGLGQIWYESGQLKQEEHFHKDILHGIQRSWYPNGQIKVEIHYTNGAYDGQRREWYQNGQLKLECSYKMNTLDGPMTEWHLNGLIKEQVHFLEGERHGIGKEYDNKGRLIQKELYIRGIRYGGRIKWLLNTNRLKASHITKMQNTALRRICLEELGYERILLELNHETINQENDCELVKINWHQDEEPLYLVKVRCSSTGVFYTLRVPPEVQTVRQAIAWTFGLNEHEYQPQEES